MKLPSLAGLLATRCRYDDRRREPIVEALRDAYPYINLIATKEPEELYERFFGTKVGSEAA